MFPTRISLPFVFAALSLCFTPLPGFAAPRQAPATSPAPVFSTNYLERIPLHYADPKRVAASLQASRLPDGVMRVSADPKEKHTLRVIGTQDGIATVRQMAAMLDVAPRQISLHFRVLRMRFLAGGKRDSTVVRAATASTTHNVPVTTSFRDTTTGDTVQFTLTPRITTKEAKQVALTVQFGVRFADGTSLGLGCGLPLPFNAPFRRIIGLTENSDHAVLNAVARGELPSRWRDTFVAYYLEMQITPPAPSPKK